MTQPRLLLLFGTALLLTGLSVFLLPSLTVSAPTQDAAALGLATSFFLPTAYAKTYEPRYANPTVLQAGDTIGTYRVIYQSAFAKTLDSVANTGVLDYGELSLPANLVERLRVIAPEPEPVAASPKLTKTGGLALTGEAREYAQMDLAGAEDAVADYRERRQVMISAGADQSEGFSRIEATLEEKIATVRKLNRRLSEREIIEEPEADYPQLSHTFVELTPAQADELRTLAGSLRIEEPTPLVAPLPGLYSAETPEASPAADSLAVATCIHQVKGAVEGRRYYLLADGEPVLWAKAKRLTSAEAAALGEGANLLEVTIN